MILDSLVETPFCRGKYVDCQLLFIMQHCAPDILDELIPQINDCVV